MRGLVVWVCLACLLTGAVAADKKKKKNKKDEEPPTQVLELPKELPGTILADGRRLSFQVSPLSNKGLLSQQVRDALKALVRLHKGATIVRLRAFVAGTGDMRRVGTILGEEFTERKLPLPVLTTVQAGGLPMEGAQVVIESVAVDKKETTPNGIAFLSGQAESSEQYMTQVAPLAQKSLEKLLNVAKGVGSAPEDLLRVTCFSTSLEDAAQVQSAAHTAFPQAIIDVVQMQRGPTRSLIECEGISKLSSAPAQPLVMANPITGQVSTNFAQAALVNSPKLIFSGSQLGFSAEEPGVRLAYQRLGKSLESAGTSYGQVAMVNTYTLGPPITEKIRTVRFSFLDEKKAPASTLVPVDGLPSLDATFAVDVVAVAP